jgi:prepilin-type processing-associated H-X9-DG protein
MVELLVTIVIVAIFAALLGGALSAARARGDAVKCANNLKQLVAANLTYATENGGKFCPAQERSHHVRWHGVRISILAPFDASRGPLAAYLGPDGRVKICPALGRVLDGIESFETGTGGYGYNSAYVGGIPGDPFTPAHLSAIISPARVVMFADTAFPRAKGLQEYAYAEPWQWEDYRGRLRGKLDPSVHFRHSGCANVGWCDGHITSEPFSMLGSRKNSYGGNSEFWMVGWFGPPENNGYWKP